MKTKIKLLALITFCLSATFTYAQEKQNDATIDETINWINEYGTINMIDLSKEIKKPHGFHYKNKNIIYYYKVKLPASQQIFLKKNNVTKLQVMSSNGIYKIKIEGNTNNDEFGYFNFGSNKNYAQKTFRAFEQLFYILDWKVECINKLVDENKF